MESPPQRLWFPIETTAGQGRRRIFDGRTVIVFLRVQEGWSSRDLKQGCCQDQSSQQPAIM
ncbi:hypothetical protein SNOG_11799 [Parastagonospora nodorum SN15]|uniref:Uncharacterized protein n=1 Tax=Phaeosphaeria nodorum (strain SN15 / ATCC MYA-4574 / FGSC 10173) TaxID=321614 RepID=Q0U8W5_PHANO|nr:hypothetical protein SNOG_11799 [Parastagonospora nodorum SN15]EAT80843.1 hypothetical protein SNOG_11799 [Parastagonospora nodorum SN15]